VRCRYTARLYASLGVDLWMLKLHTSLAVLGGTARTFTGHVRTQADKQLQTASNGPACP
jgi:hypothetical protein